MNSKAEIVRELRLLPTIKKEGEEEHESGFVAPGLNFKIRHGAIVELIGTAAAEYAVEFLVLNQHFLVYWCERDQRIFPPYLAQRGLDPTSITFGTYGKNLSEATRDLLRSELYDVIVTPSEFDDIALDRFGRLAREYDTLVLMLGQHKPVISTHIDLQLEIHRGESLGQFKHEVKKYKHGRV